MGNCCTPKYVPREHSPPVPERELVVSDVFIDLQSVARATLDLKIGDCIPYKPFIKFGKVVKVYDGDTVTVATLIKGDPHIYKFSVRLARIDAPELRTRNDVEKKAAIIVRDRLDEFIGGKMVCLENVGYDKYGRILAEVYLLKVPSIEVKRRSYWSKHTLDMGDMACIEKINVSEWLLSEKLVVPYGGGTKEVVDWGYLIGK
jgi:endonuclease YncB( thermonuclease family)